MPRRPLGLTALAILITGLGLAAQQSTVPVTSSRSTRTAAISGVVVDGVTGRAVAGVAVTLSNAALPSAIGTVTDSKGRFVFQNLPASERCTLTATKPGYSSGSLPRKSGLIFTTGIALTEGEWIADARLVIWRPGAISGRVVDDNGEPLVDVPVRALTRIPIAGAEHWATGPTVRTDDRGIYRLPGLARGQYIVTVPSVLSSVPHGTSAAAIAGRPANQFLPFAAAPAVAGTAVDDAFLVYGPYAAASPATGLAYPIAFHPGGGSLSEAVPVDLGDSEEKGGFDFVLRPVPAVRVSGRITGAADVAGRVMLRLLPEGVETLGAGSEQATALAGSDGRFMMPRVPAGRYVLEASTSVSGVATMGGRPVQTPGMSGQLSFQTVSSLPGDMGDPSSGALWSYTTGERGGYSARLPLTVGATDVSNIEIALDRGASISGRVATEGGAPLPNRLIVSVDPATGDPRLVVPFHVQQRVNSDGTFTIDGLRPGEYFLRVSSPIKSVLAGDDRTNRPLRIDAGTDTTNVLITLDSRVAELRGSVRDSKGVTVREAAVILFPAERQLWSNFGLRPTRFRSATFFGDHGYRLTYLPAGEYLAIAVDAGQQLAWQDPRFLTAASALATRVTLDWGAKSVQDLALQQVVVK